VDVRFLGVGVAVAGGGAAFRHVGWEAVSLCGGVALAVVGCWCGCGLRVCLCWVEASWFAGRWGFVGCWLVGGKSAAVWVCGWCIAGCLPAVVWMSR
jgi:hypothetical protein